MKIKEAEKELKKAFLDYLKVEHEFNELYEELKKEVSPEKITEVFKDVGEIKIRHDSVDKVEYVLEHPIFRAGRRTIIATNEKYWPEFVWEKAVTEEDSWGINHFEFDPDWYKYLSIPTFKDFKELDEYVKQAKELVTKLDKVLEKYNPLNLKIKLFEMKNVKEELYQKVSKAYEDYKDAFLVNQYGCPQGEIAVYKQYYLLNAKNDKVALVEVLEKNPSDLGYTCIDHEADDEKFFHVDASRLRPDLRGLKSMYDFRQEYIKELGYTQ